MKNSSRHISTKILCIILCGILCISAVIIPATSTKAAEFSYPLGDANLDGVITISDVSYIQNHLASYTSLNDVSIYMADVDGKSGLSINDVTLIQRHLARYDFDYPVNNDLAKIGDEIVLNGGKPEVYTKNKVYGISFDVGGEDTSCVRIEDAANLSNDYVVADEFQYSGQNDFDKVYPWCEIRRCNLSVNDNGTKNITYEGEDGFALDGSNGDVMVEIPKFYSAREVKNGKEIWAITGENKIGFNIEPAFLDSNGNVLDHIYVGAYEFTNKSYDKSHSVSGEPVATSLWMEHYRNYANDDNLTCMDYATLHALQFLYTIEFADRNTDKFMQGYSENPFYQYENNPITSISEDRYTVTIGFTALRIKNLRVGQSVSITQDTRLYQDNLLVTSLVKNDDDTATVTFDKPVTETITDLSTNNFYVTGQGQPTGTCDSLNYHTGRISQENTISTFRYRYIENIWGNVWTLIEGLRVKGLEYYFTYDTTEYADKTVENWTNSNITAPNQPYLGDDGKNRAWISEMGYDGNNPLIALPTATSTNGGSDKFFSSAIYTNYDIDRNGNILDTNTEYVCTFGGGYDHHILCGPYTMRFWFELGYEPAALHTSRVVCRK